MQTAQSSHKSASETSSSQMSSASQHSDVNALTLEYPTGTGFALTVKDKEILKAKYLKDFESRGRDLRKQVIGNAVRELAMLRPQGSQPSKRKATRVCAIYSNMWA